MACFQGISTLGKERSAKIAAASIGIRPYGISTCLVTTLFHNLQALRNSNRYTLLRY